MTDEPHALSGAYAVHALPAAEGKAFERHLASCPACAAEVRALRETAARLALPTAQPPPPTLRARLLAAAREITTRESADREVRQAAGDPEPGDVTVWHGGGGGTVVLLPEIPVTPEPGVATLRPRRRTRVLAGLAAVSAAAAVLLGVLAVQARHELSDLARRDDTMLALLAAPDAETITQPVTGGGTASVLLSRTRGGMVFTAANLPRPPASRVYELWLMGPAGARPAGLVAAGDVLILRPAGDDARIGLTVEPAGGSKRPTTQPVMLADLPAA
ncbi:anti-sigma factor domain-containing protein [Nonomuraea sp. NPDC050536]|uniref:anti-sigma factor n=1 Tax=Nonomuraea sp. NPDC050536 TaxID=3364366 RepID=UPI0037C5D4F3